MHHPYIDEYSGIDSFIHRLEPRVKVIGFFALIVFIALIKPGSFFILGLCVILTAVLILLSGIPFRFILKRLLAAVPFVLMVSVFIPFIKNGRPTADGWALFCSIVIKSSLCICSMVLLMNSMRFCDFLKALEKLKVPPPITLILSFMYRYIFVIADEFMKMKQARESRSPGGSRWLNFKAHAFMAGVLFLRSYERAERVYLAMCARGYAVGPGGHKVGEGEA
ncbi:MAG: cobalt ECF transporter T component CbiQ [Candidatus Omnitrophota bacterium]